jgi:hypothetical protein
MQAFPLVRAMDAGGVVQAIRKPLPATGFRRRLGRRGSLTPRMPQAKSSVSFARKFIAASSRQ